ncbi:MAG TPA: hypothetical protein VN963_10340, partial [bacterium]|nr:hypothetical protein [bacterium]
MLAAKKGTARKPVLIKSPIREINHNHNGEEFKNRLLKTLTSLNDGNFSVRLPSNLDGLDGKVADAFNEIIGRMERYGDDLFRLRKEVGQKGKINERLPMGDSVGGWADQIDA